MAKLLFITQKMDKDDDLLGIYHRWAEELAKRMEKVSIICLRQGTVELPKNAPVYSLGKESGRSRFKYLFRFYRYLWQLRKNYDSVLVHMNVEYVILGGLFWKILGKKIFLWYNHPLGGLRARLAFKLSDKIFHTSPFAFATRFKKSEIMPAGVDAQIFQRDDRIKKIKNSALYLGRISPIKNLDFLIEAAEFLDKQGNDFRINIVGSPARKDDFRYEEAIKLKASPLVAKGKIRFMPKVSNKEAPRIYNENEIGVNLTPGGSFDKTILEAMACEMPVLVSNRSFENILPKECRFEEGNSRDLAEKLSVLFKLPQETKLLYGQRFREYVLKNHDLPVLMNKLIPEITNYD